MKHALAVLLCVMIVGILWLVFAPVRGTSSTYREQVMKPRSVRTTITQFNTGLVVFERDCGCLPPLEIGLLGLAEDPGLEDWDGPYLIWVPSDPWGCDYPYRIQNGAPVVTSAGPDRILGTDDDITTQERYEPREPGA